jgi:serine phosphatase RsbU (regulator of sigma subunit)
VNRRAGSTLRFLVPFAPAAVLLAVVTADLVSGRHNVLLGLTAIAPLVAANLVGPRLTALYAVAALVTAALLGVYGGQYEPGPRAAQAVRLTAVLLAGLTAVWAARYRQRREARLVQVSRVAEVAQRAILLPVPSHMDGVDLAVHYESAAVEATVGGDLYAAVSTPYGLRVLVGDVRGKGLDAVRIAAHVLAAFRERANDRVGLELLALDLDRAVRRVGGGEDFVTAVLAQIDPAGRLSLLNAGHPPPFLVRGPELTVLEPPDPRPPLGLNGSVPVRELRLHLDDRLLLYTDGLTEARRPADREFFPESLVAPSLGTGTLSEGLEALRRRLLDWSGGHLSDDVALVAAQRAGGA